MRLGMIRQQQGGARSSVGDGHSPSKGTAFSETTLPKPKIYNATDKIKGTSAEMMMMTTKSSKLGSSIQKKRHSKLRK